jgi:ERCC4-related helicase
VIAVLEDKEEDEKVLIFSEYPNTLRAIKALLPEIGLQSRNLIGGSGAGAHAVLGDSTVAVAVAMAVVSALTAAVQNACG